MDPQQGEIFWIDIPAGQTQGSEQYGRRPFIVMSRTALNKVLKTVVVVPMTTFGDQADTASTANQPPFRIVIPAAEITKDVSSTSQISLSVAKTDQVRVVDKTRLGTRIGRLSQTAIISVGAGVAFVFDIR